MSKLNLNTTWPPDWIFQARYTEKLIPREKLLPNEHPITPANFPPQVVWIMDRLKNNGYSAYLVGGTVRDLLLGKTPKDYDISTDATPREILRLFANSRLIGRRFLLVHIFFRDGNFIEVSTFRALRRGKRYYHSPRRRDNQFGTLIEDVWRRDLTINALLYDSKTGEVLDYVGGLEDLRGKVIRTVGPPSIRFREDPVRMFRAIRHSSRLGFYIDGETWRAIRRGAWDIKLCSPARVFEEFMRELRGGYSENSLRLMYNSGLLNALFQEYSRWINRLGSDENRLWDYFHFLDQKLNRGDELSDIFLFSWFIFPYLSNKFSLKNFRKTRKNRGPALEELFKALRLSHPFRQQVKRFLQMTANTINREKYRKKRVKNREFSTFYNYLSTALASTPPKK